MAMERSRAHAVMAAASATLPTGHSIRVHPVGSGELWSGTIVDEAGRPQAGAATLIGPDERVWVLSSNPGIHDYVLGVRLLEEAYRSGLVAALDESAFLDRLAELTRRHHEEERDFLRDLRAGSLRAQKTRRLP